MLAPLEAVSATLQRGTEVLVEVVVRNRGVGHFFPGGTIDAFDVWVEFTAVEWAEFLPGAKLGEFDVTA